MWFYSICIQTQEHKSNFVHKPRSSASRPKFRNSFNKASPKPNFMRSVASQQFSLNLSNEAKAFVLNADMDLKINTN